ncbi:hypothetical protein NQZ68_000816 [Dissostichus eleginoides]|nr:hypothetical protein NQZ68_000816 [Dissostichus eleginoides]
MCSNRANLCQRQPAAAPYLHLSEGCSPERKRGDGGRQEVEEEGWKAGWREGADGFDETQRSRGHSPGERNPPNPDLHPQAHGRR